MSAKEWTLLEKGLKQRVRALNMFLRDIYHGRDILRANIIPDDLIFQNPVFRPGNERPGRAARRLRSHRRDRHRPGRRRQFHRAGGQCADALGRVLHAGKPRNHDAAVSGPVRPPPRSTRGTLSRRIAVGVALGGAAVGLSRADGRADDARRLQFRLLRTFVPRRQAGNRAGRGPRPHRQERRGVHAHHRGAEARRRDLPPRRRRFPRSADLPPGFGARRARPDVGLCGRQRHAGERGRHRDCRRQGDLFLHARGREILSRRRADPEERADLALPRAEGPVLRARQFERAGGEGSPRLRRLRHADRPCRDQGDDRGVPRQAQARARRVLSPSRRWRCRPARPAPRPASRRAMSISGRSC